MRLLVDVKPIMQFMAQHYTDERLAMLRAHAEDGRLSYVSCCCFIGVATADHPLKGRIPGLVANAPWNTDHLFETARKLSGAQAAETAASRLSVYFEDSGFCTYLLALILWEQRRRDRLHAVESATTAMSCVVKGA